MNTFRRGEKFDGHMITALPTRYVCVECGSELVFLVLSVAQDGIKCNADEEHTGLLRRELWDQTRHLAEQAKRDDEVQRLTQMKALDPAIAQLEREQRRKNLEFLFPSD